MLKFLRNAIGNVAIVGLMAIGAKIVYNHVSKWYNAYRNQGKQPVTA